MPHSTPHMDLGGGGIHSLLVKIFYYANNTHLPNISGLDGIICGILQITVWYIQMTCTNTQSFDNIIETATYTVGLPGIII